MKILFLSLPTHWTHHVLRWLFFHFNTWGAKNVSRLIPKSTRYLYILIACTKIDNGDVCRQNVPGKKYTYIYKKLILSSVCYCVCVCVTVCVLYFTFASEHPQPSISHTFDFKEVSWDLGPRP